MGIFGLAAEIGIGRGANLASLRCRLLRDCLNSKFSQEGFSLLGRAEPELIIDTLRFALKRTIHQS